MTTPFDEVEALAPGRFRNPLRLGSGVSGSVFAVDDSARGERLALKVLRRTTGGWVSQLKNEFRAASNISHPNLVLLYELLSDGTRWGFTMQLVAGTPIGQRAASPGGRLSEAELRSSMGQLAAGVAALHSAGQLHRDIKHSNVLVNEAGTVTLLDFGLASPLTSASSDFLRRSFAGSPAFLSPEQIRGGRLTPASDWYAFGTLLYELLTGQLPYLGPPEALLSRKLSQEVPHPSTLGMVASTELANLCVRLLAREAEDRPDGIEVLRAFGRDEGSVVLDVAPTARLADAQLVGREDEIFRVEDWLWKLRSGGPRMVVLSGPSGIGKTTIAQAVAQRSTERGATVLSSKCHHQETVPFNAWDGAIDELSALLLTDPGRAPGGLDPALFRLFPVLYQETGESEPPPASLGFVGDQAERRTLAVRAFTALFRSLSQSREVVLVLDDLHWGDRDSIRLLRDLLGAGDAPAVKIVATIREEELEGGPFGQFLAEPGFARLGTVIEVGPLDIDACFEVLGQLPEAVMPHKSRIARQAQGSPFLLQEFARELALSENEPLSASPATVRTLVARRLARVSESTRALLEIVAVFRRPIPLRLALDAAGLAGAGSEEVARLRAAGLVRVRGKGESLLLEGYHSFMMQGVLENVPVSRARAHQSALAHALMRRPAVDHEAVAHCLAQAGLPTEAAVHAEHAARAAESTLAFARATSWFAQALSWSAAHGKRRLELLRRLGGAAQAAGDGKAAGQAFWEAASLVQDADEEGRLLRFELERRAAHSYLMSGEREEGERVLTLLLERSGYSVPGGTASVLSSFAVARLALRARGLSWNPKPATPQQLECLHALDVATVCWLNLDPTRSWLFAMWHLRAALRSSTPSQLLRALASELIFSSMGAVKSPAWPEKLLDAGARVLPEVADERALGWWDQAQGMHALLRGEWQKAIHLGEQAERRLALRCQGAHWELELVRRNYVGAIQIDGNMAAPEAKLREWLLAAEERSDADGVASHLLGLGYVACAQDNPTEALGIVERVRALITDEKSDLHLHVNWLNAFTCSYVEAEPALLLDALERLKRFWSTSQRLVPFFRSWTAGYEARLMTGLAACGAGDGSTRWQQGMLKAVARLRDEGSAAALAQALQTEASIALLAGSRKEAIRGFYETEQAYRAAGMRLFAGSSGYAAARLAGSARELNSRFFELKGELGVANVESMVRAHILLPLGE